MKADLATDKRERRAISQIREKYLGRVLDGDENGAWSLVALGLSQGISALQLYLDVIIFAQSRVGELWHQGTLNIAEEHQATQITLSLINRLRGHFPRKAELPFNVAVTSVEGEMHSIGVRMVADLLFIDGWRVHYLGPNTPSKDLTEFVEKNQIALVCLSVTLDVNVDRAEASISELHGLENPPRVLLGGGAIRDEEHAISLGADGFSNDILSFSEVARALVGLGAGYFSLEDYLSQLGQRIQRLRKDKGISQQELANQAGLDRTYISALENGKQNVTLAAVSRLATALGWSIDELLNITAVKR